MVFTSIFLVFYLSLVCGQQWDYQGQNRWGREFTSCSGSRQSPININANRVRRNPSLRLDISAYNEPQRNVILHNSGHSAEILLNSRSLRPSISGSAVGDGNTYIFQNMHFHWGESNLRGTEHSVDNDFGSAEIHFVHYNQDFESFESAVNREGGIVVVTILLQLSRENNTAIEPLIRHLPQIHSYNSSAVIRRLNFIRIFPKNLRTFFRYSGSLTTPPCSETVTFIIYSETIGISALQLSQFRRLFEEPKRGINKRLVSNVRDIQRLNGRTVDFSSGFRRNILFEDDLDDFDSSIK